MKCNPGSAVSGLGFGALACLLLGGCHSRFVNANVVNHSGADVSLLEVDYPSASFGVEQLAAGKTLKYRFKISGSGAAKLSWTDPHHQDHTASGPVLTEGQEGALTITILPETAQWDAQLKP